MAPKGNPANITVEGGGGRQIEINICFGSFADALIFDRTSSNSVRWKSTSAGFSVLLQNPRGPRKQNHGALNLDKRTKRHDPEACGGEWTAPVSELGTRRQGLQRQRMTRAQPDGDYSFYRTVENRFLVTYEFISMYSPPRVTCSLFSYLVM
ncbi:hypothetical protein R1flu_014456 [Riccia fluitans]|uniref:Uncharacterized protein n=1 Tax=Riccia fluitans TaxID=41844 RepID=A0ABD1YGW4_9MARC